MNVGDCIGSTIVLSSHSKTLGLYILWEWLFANIWAGMKLTSHFGNIEQPGIRVETVCESHGTLGPGPLRIPSPQFYNRPNDRTFSFECRVPAQWAQYGHRLTELLLFSAQQPSIFFAPHRHCYTRLGPTILIATFELRNQNQNTFFLMLGKQFIAQNKRGYKVTIINSCEGLKCCKVG